MYKIKDYPKLDFRLVNRLAGWVVFLIASLTYILTAEPTASLWDCGEFITTSVGLQVGHPPGAPLFMIISRLFAIFAPSKETQALMINCMSALCSGFTVLFLFWSITHLARKLVVKEGEELALGGHTLAFYTAPMVHWPEVMVSFEKTSGTLFSADGFGRFGDTNPDTPWVDEARRYYINIVGKYGVQVQALLKKAAGLEIETVCPLHGPILNGEALALALEKYGVWSSYAPEEKGVLVAYASIHGHTAKAALELADLLRAEGLQVEAIDLTRRDWAEAVAGAFRYSGLVLAAASYDAGVFPPMAQFLARLKHKGFRDRVVGMVENGSWGPTALRTMLAELEGMKGLTILEPKITIRSAATDENRAQMRELARAMAGAI